MNIKTILSIILCAFAILLHYYYPVLWDYIKIYFKSDKNKIKLFSSDELNQYNGVDKSELYLSILGNVFDVTKGSKYYGPGESYYIFIGQNKSLF